jgi:hypothetical protein
LLLHPAFRADRRLAPARHRPPVLPLALVICAVVPAVAAGQQAAPTPEPLWKAYPLDTGKPKSATPLSRPAEQLPSRPGSAETTRPLSDPDGRSAPALVQALLFGAAGAILALAFAWGVLPAWRAQRSPRDVRRGRADGPAAGSGLAPPKPSAGTTCEIGWSPSARGVTFQATADLPGRGADVIAESPPVAPPDAGAPPKTLASRLAHQQLVQALEGAGWERCGRGSDWYAMRFRRRPSPPRRRGRRRG